MPDTSGTNDTLAAFQTVGALNIETQGGQTITSSPVQPDAPMIRIQGEPYMFIPLNGGGYIVSRWLNGKQMNWAHTTQQGAAQQLWGWLNPTMPPPSVDTIVGGGSQT